MPANISRPRLGDKHKMRADIDYRLPVEKQKQKQKIDYLYIHKSICTLYVRMYVCMLYVYMYVCMYIIMYQVGGASAERGGAVVPYRVRTGLEGESGHTDTRVLHACKDRPSMAAIPRKRNKYQKREKTN